jgi:oligoribonuclease NrnB/cAMP/cGMP phosphodiesterase (DHH superfamily)
MTNKYDYVIYHRGCTDGFASFIVLTTTHKIDDNALIYTDVPSAKNIPPNIKDKNVIIMDVAYKKEILEKIFSLAKKVTFIDHHDSIKDDVAQLKAHEMYSHHEVIYDDSKSGVALTWCYFYGKKTKKIPLFVRYISDNDTGTWKFKDTKPFITGLRVKYDMDQTKDNIEKWKHLFDKKEVKYLIKKGLQYEEYQNFLIHENLKRYSLERFPSEKIFNEFPGISNKPGEYKVIVYNGGGCPNASLLGAKFVESIDSDFCIIWVLNLDRGEYVLQFRSKSVDVGNIAKVLGGGGHVLASSCSLSAVKYNMRDLFFPKSLPRQ